MQNNEYANYFGISQSMLKKWGFLSPLQWKKYYIDKQNEKDKEKNSFTFGSLVDTLLFTPAEYDKRFVILDDKSLPSETIAGIIKNYYQKIIDFNNNLKQFEKELPDVPVYKKVSLEHEDFLLQEADNYISKDKEGNEKIGWNNNWKKETRLKTLTEKGKAYFDTLVKCDNRQIVSQSLVLEAENIKNILQNNESVKHYFVPTENIELLFQLEIFVPYKITVENQLKELPLKGALDIVKIDHKAKTIQIVDFKTDKSAYNFIQSIKQYGYVDQLSYYMFLLELWKQSYCEGKYCDYTIIAPANVVIDVYDKYPYVYVHSDTDLLASKIGYVQTFFINIDNAVQESLKYKTGWLEKLQQIAWHYFTNQWNAPKELLQQGFIKVNLLNY